MPVDALSGLLGDPEPDLLDFARACVSMKDSGLSVISESSQHDEVS